MKSTFMHAYSHSIINTSVARLPYVIANPVDISTYMEKTYEKMLQPRAVKMAPPYLVFIVQNTTFKLYTFLAFVSSVD